MVKFFFITLIAGLGEILLVQSPITLKIPALLGFIPAFTIFPLAFQISLPLIFIAFFALAFAFTTPPEKGRGFVYALALLFTIALTLILAVLSPAIPLSISISFTMTAMISVFMYLEWRAWQNFTNPQYPGAKENAKKMMGFIFIATFLVPAITTLIFTLLKLPPITILFVGIAPLMVFLLYNAQDIFSNSSAVKETFKADSFVRQDNITVDTATNLAKAIKGEMEELRISLPTPFSLDSLIEAIKVLKTKAIIINFSHDRRDNFVHLMAELMHQQLKKSSLFCQMGLNDNDQSIIILFILAAEKIALDTSIQPSDYTFLAEYIQNQIRVSPPDLNTAKEQKEGENILNEYIERLIPNALAAEVANKIIQQIYPNDTKQAPEQLLPFITKALTARLKENPKAWSSYSSSFIEETGAIISERIKSKASFFREEGDNMLADQGGILFVLRFNEDGNLYATTDQRKRFTQITLRILSLALKKNPIFFEENPNEMTTLFSISQYLIQNNVAFNFAALARIQKHMRVDELSTPLQLETFIKEMLNFDISKLHPASQPTWDEKEVLAEEVTKGNAHPGALATSMKRLLNDVGQTHPALDPKDANAPPSSSQSP